MFLDCTNATAVYRITTVLKPLVWGVIGVMITARMQRTELELISLIKQPTRVPGLNCHSLFVETLLKFGLRDYNQDLTRTEFYRSTRMNTYWR